jgi:hypothetical protein
LSQFLDKDGSAFFFCEATNASVFEHPNEVRLKELIVAERLRQKEAAIKAKLAADAAAIKAKEEAERKAAAAAEEEEEPELQALHASALAEPEKSGKRGRESAQAAPEPEPEQGAMSEAEMSAFTALLAEVLLDGWVDGDCLKVAELALAEERRRAADAATAWERRDMPRLPQIVAAEAAQWQ